MTKKGLLFIMTRMLGVGPVIDLLKEGYRNGREEKYINV